MCRDMFEVTEQATEDEALTEKAQRQAVVDQIAWGND